MRKIIKKKIVILSTPAYGHINPILPIAQELVGRGHDVLFYSTEEFKKVIEATGSRFVSYRNSKLKYIDSNAMKNAFMLADFIIKSTWDVLKHQTFTKKNKPDIIIHDCLVLWGKVLAHKYSIPVVCYSVAMLVDPKILLRYPNLDLKIMANSLLHGFRIQRQYKHLLKTAGIPYKGFNDIFINEEKCTLVFTTKYFQPYSDKFGKNFTFVGPSFLPNKKNNKKLNFLKKNSHVVYISLGTLTNNDINFFKTCIDAFRDTKYIVVISLGKKLSISSLQPLPDNIFVKDYWPQLSVLGKAELFITHGGMNSIMESAYYGVPMIVVPQRTEQRICALRLHELGGGIFIDKKKFTKEKLLDAVNKIVKDKSFTRQTKLLQKSVKKSGGYKRAVEKILFHSN